MRPSVLLDQRGSALVESIGSITFATLAFIGGLSMIYVSFAHLWLKHAAYEASICLSTPESALNCRLQLERATAQALPVGHLDSVQLHRRPSSVETKFRWQLADHVSLAIEDARSLPLLGPSEITPRALRPHAKVL